MGSKSRIGFVVGAVVALAAALAVGINDNLPGIALLYVASVSLVLAVAHRWRRVKPFVWLLVGSLVLFPVAAVLHNAFYALGELVDGVRVLKSVLDAFHVTFFLTAILLSPAGVAVGAVGSLVTWSRTHKAA
jgi:hypothetical protein